MKSTKHIVIVEDEADLLANYKAALNQHGYQVTGIPNREQAETFFSRQLPDLAILDIGLGDEPDAGFDLCRNLRQQSVTLPILILTARDHEVDVVSGLRLGADDYLSKDISMPHLLARVASLFRRSELTGNNQQLKQWQQGPLTVLTDNLQIKWHDQNVPLTVTEFWMVQSLARYPGQVKTREQLMHDANIYVDEGTITSHVKRIRKKFMAIDPQSDCIETVHGMGYRWRQ
ncbi:response regulator [Marinicella gelatinilytica]|uniref:response regulator n=1 Tax=Marinicella gelatinilytica TaxID=2996017 RepID=UPI00226087A9|nr:response regulator [Marinicella gelatinilytica]MCX7545068.1 response regulator [Marinicella gelatinilytica]